MSLTTNPTRARWVVAGWHDVRIVVPVEPTRDDYTWDAADGWLRELRLSDQFRIVS